MSDASGGEDPPRRGRPTDYRPEFCAQAEELCKLGAIDKDLAELFEVDERTINRWKDAHPEFRQSIRAGKILADMAVAGRLHQRALGFEFEENHPVKLKRTTYDGSGKKLTEEEVVQVVPVKRVVPPDTLAAKFWLTNRQRDKWAERIHAEHTGKDGGPIETAEVAMTEVERARRIAFILAKAARADSREGNGQDTPQATQDPDPVP